MPFSDDELLRLLLKRYNKLTRLLYAVTKEVGVQSNVPGHEEWWVEHQRLDEEKKQLEEKHKAETEEALAKLTLEERKALGLL